jgi:predicted adenylyl cyclase CyaB
MKNLEHKSLVLAFPTIPNASFEDKGILSQSDTYYALNATVNPNTRLKLREEYDINGKFNAYMISYDRENVEGEKMSEYHFFPVADVAAFKKVVANGLTEKYVVSKRRHLYLYKNARVHFDSVANVGNFVEIEVVIKTDEDEKNTSELMEELLSLLNLKQNKKIAEGYAQLLENKMSLR